MDIRDVNIAIFFGGPSTERDISLDSARTFFDSLRTDIKESRMSLLFVAPNKDFFKLDPSWLYSNKIEDFLRPSIPSSSGKNYGLKRLDQFSLHKHIMKSQALCSFIHGEFGEDGELPELLVNMGRKAILGSSSETLKLLFNKFETHKNLDSWGYPTVKRRLINANDDYCIEEITNSFSSTSSCLFAVKPNRGGSSDGVSISSKFEMASAIKSASRFDDQIIVEEKINGREFSIVLIQDFNDEIIPFFPTEIKLNSKRRENSSHNYYSRIKKYLPGSGAEHQTPIAVNQQIVENIRSQAKELFIKFKLEDWARFDGFLAEDGQIIWSDLNGIPGYGIDSFFFQQAALHKLDQRAISLLLLRRVLQKENISIDGVMERPPKKKKISVIGGGVTSEKNVSRMSWLNVIQKLDYLRKYEVNRIFMTETGEIWKVPHFISLQHTVKEIENLIQHPRNFIKYYRIAQNEVGGFSSELKDVADLPQFTPQKTTLNDLAKEADFVFNALHGGLGEDGTIQRILDRLGVAYNGSGHHVSNLCINKYRTCQELGKMEIHNFRAPHQFVLNVASLKEWIIKSGVQINDAGKLNFLSYTDSSLDTVKSAPVYQQIEELMNTKIEEWKRMLHSNHGIVVKPLNDGCSSGVLVSTGECDEVPAYFIHLFAKFDEIQRCRLGGRFFAASPELKFIMPSGSTNELLVEEYLGDNLDDEDTDFIEITVGVVGERGKMMALLPSKTPSNFGALTLEEKFCKGVGVNLIPPSDLDQDKVESIKKRVLKLANGIGLEGYARIDLMYKKEIDQLILIEVNTLPGLSVATVIFTQAYVTKEFGLCPSDFIDYLIDLGFRRAANRSLT